MTTSEALIATVMKRRAEIGLHVRVTFTDGSEPFNYYAKSFAERDGFMARAKRAGNVQIIEIVSQQ